MQRVAVIGCGGSGKTTLANELSARLGLPLIHIDSHYWQLRDGRRVESSPEQWTARHRALINQPAWVIDGMKLGVLSERLERADTVIYLDMPTRTCLTGIARRRLRYRGRLRPDLGVYDRITWEFLRWVCAFRRRQRPVLLRELDAFNGEAVILRRRRDVPPFLEFVRSQTEDSTAQPPRGDPRRAVLPAPRAAYRHQCDDGHRLPDYPDPPGQLDGHPRSVVRCCGDAKVIAVVASREWLRERTFARGGRHPGLHGHRGLNAVVASVG